MRNVEFVQEEYLKESPKNSAQLTTESVKKMIPPKKHKISKSLRNLQNKIKFQPKFNQRKFSKDE